MRCNRCDLCKTSGAGKHSWVLLEGVGPTDADIMIVGEAPGADEIIQKKPFVGKCGNELRKKLMIAGLDADEIYITNVVKCRPPANRTPTDKEIAICSVYLKKEILKIKPKVICALGNVPTKFFLGKKGITKLRGKEIWNKEYNCWIVPAYHPAYLMRFIAKAKQHSEFLQDLGRVKTLVTTQAEQGPETKIAVCDTRDKVKKAIDLLLEQKVVAFDTETDQLSAFGSKILCETFSWKKGKAIYIPFEDYRFWKKESDIEFVKKQLKRFHESKVFKIGQNVKFDLKHLLEHGIKNKNLYFDTMVAAYLLDEEGLRNLAHLALIYTDMVREYKDELRDYIRGKIKIDEGWEEVEVKQRGKKKQLQLKSDKVKKKTQRKRKYRKSNIWDAPVEKLITYAGRDADATFRVYLEEKNLLKKEKLEKLFYKILIPAINALVYMELTGIKGDKEYVGKVSARLALKINILKVTMQKDKQVQEFLEEYGKDEINFNSPKDLRAFLFDYLELTPIKYSKETKKPSTDQETLKNLNQQYKINFLDNLMMLRKAEKFHSTYLNAYKQLLEESLDGRIHTTYNITGTVTGRLSSNSPNLQNIPKRGEEAKIVRRAFIAEKEWILLAADFKQLEFRVFAHAVRCPDLQEMARKEDIHRSVSSRIFKIPECEVKSDQRDLAKVTVFGGILYGGGPAVVVRSSGIEFQEAERIIREFFEEFPRAAQYIENEINFARKYGFVRNIFGRKRRLNGLYSKKDGERGHAERQVINSPIQSAASDIVLITKKRVFKEVVDKDCRLLLNIHDDLTFEIRKNKLEDKAKKIKRIMEESVQLSVPLKVDIEVGENLAKMKEINI